MLEKLNSIIELFGDDIEIHNNTYRSRLLNNCYDDKHYERAYRMLMYTYSNEYTKGDKVVLDIYINRIRVKVNQLTWIFNKTTKSLEVVTFTLNPMTETSRIVKIK